MPTYALLGAAGSTGSSLLSYLLERPSSTRADPLTVNAYARSLSQIPAAYRSSSKVHFFTGSLSPESLKPCIKDADVIFQCVGQNLNEPGCSVAQQVAHAIIQSLEPIKRESQKEHFKCPVVVFLSSNSLNPTFSAEAPRLLRWVLERGNFYVYTDLRKALAYLKNNAPWIPLIMAEPPGLVHDIPRGFELRRKTMDGPTPLLSYADLARAMVDMVEGPGGPEEWVGKGVGICGTSKDVKKDVLPLIKLQITGLIAYFFPGLFKLGNGSLW